jgi:hypothetical protein
MTNLILIALATWYLSYAITATHGPFRVFEILRKSIPHGGLLECPICLSPYMAMILLLVPMGVVVQALALAGAAMLLHGFSGWRFGGG